MGAIKKGNTGVIAAARKNPFAGAANAVFKSVPSVLPKTNGASAMARPGFVLTVNGFT